MKILRSVELGFSDWLYFLSYQIDCNGDFDGTFEDQVLQIFDECRKRRFRFNNPLLYSENALVDMSYQYGNYHLAKLNLQEDFIACHAQSIVESIKAFINHYAFSSVTELEKKEAVTTIESVLHGPINERSVCFELDIEKETLISKKAPFETFDYFKSYLIFFDTNNIRKFEYIEIGSD